MADASKAHKLKLANSRKRFKELQELKKKKNDISKSSDSADNDMHEQTPVDSLTSSTHSSINNEITNEHSSAQATQLPNYFNTPDYGDNSMFFETISQKPSENNSFNVHPPSSLAKMVKNIVETPQSDIKSPFEEDNYSLFNQNYQHSYIEETQQIIRPHKDTLTLDDPEIKENEIFEHHKKKSENNPFSEQNKQSLIDYLYNESQDSIENTLAQNQIVQNADNAIEEIQNSNLNRQNLIDYLNKETQDSSIANTLTQNQIVQNANNAIEGIQNSNINSVNYYSNQMAQYQPSNSITDLEKRNIELSSSLEQEKLISDQQRVKISEFEQRILQLQKEISSKDNLSEINKLKEELQCHSQTIRLLVGEKTELSTNLVHLESNFKQKQLECDELQARLKNSRSRAFELEQELNSIKSEKMQKDSNGHEQNEILENLRRDFDNIRDQKDELYQDLLEVSEKLKTTFDENSTLHKSNVELSNKLSMAEVKIQQLSNTDHHVAEAEVAKLIQDKTELEKELASLNSMLKNITKERDESTSHYQHYTEELNSQLATLQEQFQRLQQENENLAVQEQNRIRHIGDLERQLQNAQNDRVTFSSNFSDNNLKTELESTKELCIQLQMEKTELEENYTKTLNEKDMLLKELSAKNDSLSQLDSMVEQLRGNQPDSVKLLATMESDKVAAARAVQQNKELKEQLESMQEVFAKMDNDKVDLTEKLSIEVTTNRDLLDKLQKTELQLQRLTDAIEIKDRELSLLRDSSTELNKQVLQQEQLADRLRHYEAHDNSSHVLQAELQEAKQTVIKLTNEINVLRNSRNEPESANDENIALRSQVGELKLKNQELESKLENHAEIDNNYNSTSESNKEENLDKCEHMIEKEEAMVRLEEKVKRTMQEIADLSDEKQRLEHLVLQLQGETETIGEYVALYQHQRMVLKQKAVEKDMQLKQLATDREQIKAKLDKLNLLVERLIKEKRVGPDLLTQYENINGQQQIINTQDEPKPSSIPGTTPSDINAEAAEEILALLTEIKTSNLVDPKETVHSCPYCSGQLITV